MSTAPLYLGQGLDILSTLHGQLWTCARHADLVSFMLHLQSTPNTTWFFLWDTCGTCTGSFKDRSYPLTKVNLCRRGSVGIMDWPVNGRTEDAEVIVENQTEKVVMNLFWSKVHGLLTFPLVLMWDFVDHFSQIWFRNMSSPELPWFVIIRFVQYLMNQMVITFPSA